MNFIRDVLAFHSKFRHHTPTPGKPTLLAYPFELRTRLIVEEAVEFATACGYRVLLRWDGTIELEATGHCDWPDMIDACIDLLYVVVGALIAMGLDYAQIEVFWNEVHEANMRKSMKKDEKSTPGKTLKPPGWIGPRMNELLSRMVNRP